MSSDVRAVTATEASSVRLLMGGEERRTAGPSYYTWKYGNPASEIFGAFDGDRLLAIAGVQAKPWLTAIVGAEVYEIGDTFTLPEAQGKGLFRQLVETCMDWVGPEPVVYGTPNANSLPGYVRRLGFEADHRSLFQVAWPRSAQAFARVSMASVALRWVLNYGAVSSASSAPRHRCKLKDALDAFGGDFEPARAAALASATQSRSSDSGAP